MLIEVNYAFGDSKEVGVGNIMQEVQDQAEYLATSDHTFKSTVQRLPHSSG